ncbi:hypothetical protein COY90_05455 [Candidatus Roizmanbacteria bacterium CG_4_10_14_0_8_um_filter_39_9]|uniref:Uncharacterized protein n=1 Tax=Candidatus Roizmanbacteria bacterium CG_4_10_14_0_8_um_filter_39_9 TaxID=1974829 RepID=A0A2M7QBD7_9BACT|nr:MAG: hypothetical protein COY90_05455 [Candidatus Roizmanbacteria bacterium CG_4_10_14_0_8_um_filter_39_9]
MKLKSVFFVIKKRWYVFVIIAAGVGIFLYQQQSTKAQVAKLATYTVKRQDLQDILTLSGQVAADDHVVLRFQSSGKLTWVGAKVGDVVKKYQGIASLDTRDLKMRLQKNLNSFASQRGTFDQSRDDNQRVGDQPIRENGDRMKRLLEDAQYDLSSSVLDVELSDLALEYSYLYTPIAGVVVRADVTNPGTNITPAGAEFEIINPDTLYFSFIADQTEVIRLKEGIRGEILLDSYPDDKIKGELYYISYIPKAGETGTVYEGRIKMPVDQEMKYRFGMTGDTEFVMGEKNNVIAAPDKFIKAEGDKKYVMRLHDGKEEKVYIKTGLEVDGNVEILSGIEEGNVILSVQK